MHDRGHFIGEEAFGGKKPERAPALVSAKLLHRSDAGAIQYAYGVADIDVAPAPPAGERRQIVDADAGERLAAKIR